MVPNDNSRTFTSVPDRTFHKSGAVKYVERRFWATYEARLSPEFKALKLSKFRSGPCRKCSVILATRLRLANLFLVVRGLYWHNSTIWVDTGSVFFLQHWTRLWYRDRLLSINLRYWHSFGNMRNRCMLHTTRYILKLAARQASLCRS